MRRLALSLWLSAGAALAQGETDVLRPSGPVTVTADRAEWQDGGIMRYSGKVALTSETLQLSGDTLELRQFGDGQYEAKISGAPARLSHAGGTDRNNKPVPPVNAEARNLAYDSRTGVVDILGGARMTRGTDEITGEEIHYNALQRRIQAAGGEQGQVKIVIQPPQQKSGDEKKNSP